MLCVIHVSIVNLSVSSTLEPCFTEYTELIAELLLYVLNIGMPIPKRSSKCLGNLDL